MNSKPVIITVIIIVVVLALAGGIGYFFFFAPAPATPSAINNAGSPTTTATSPAPVVTAPTSTSPISPATSTTGVLVSSPCTSADPNIALPAGIHGLQVLFPPSAGQPEYNDVMTYLANNPSAPVCGAVISIPWGTVDKGPGADPQYDFSTIDAEIAPWVKAGKQVDFAVSATTYGNGAASLANLPSYVKSAVDIISCQNEVPVYWESSYMKPYQAFMKAVVDHYGSDPSVGYIRFGLGMGGETGLVFGFGTASCTSQLTKYGYTQTVWENYLASMLAYEKSLNSPKQLMVAINVLQYGNDQSVPDSTAAAAVANGIGFGSEGLSSKDITKYAAGQPCISDWCALFNKYEGQVPLELQTVMASNESGSGQTGPLTTILPFAVGRHAQDLELYWQDWLSAFDPHYAGYAQYGTAYAQAFNNAAAVIGK